MTTSIGARATSFAAAAALIGLIGLAALSMSITLQRTQDWGQTPPPVFMERPPPPPEPILRPQAARPLPPDAPPAETFEEAPPPPAPPDDSAGVYVPGPPGPAEIANPAWLRRPSNLTRYYPARALERGVEGDVVLDCLVSTRGALACSVVSETPPGWGFADAARRISRDHLMVPASRDGLPVEGRYRMRVPFRVQG